MEPAPLCAKSEFGQNTEEAVKIAAAKKLVRLLVLLGTLIVLKSLDLEKWRHVAVPLR
jgi:hypothetical protein